MLWDQTIDSFQLHAVLAVHSSLVVTCWKMADLDSLVCEFLLCFCDFSMQKARCGT